MKNGITLGRAMRHAVAICALAAGSLAIECIRPAKAEFEIQEAGVEKGEVEVEYRGAVHWGLPKSQADSGIGGDETQSSIEQDLAGQEEEIALRQSHDLEVEMGITDRWLISATLGTIVPDGENWQTDAVEAETQLEVIERHGNGIGFAMDASYARSVLAETPNECQFGPIFEFGLGNFLLTTNTYFGKQLGRFADQEGLGFEYGWRGEYDFGARKRWGVGVEMFGGIEDLANAGSFNDQEHSIGPTIFFKPGGAENDDDEAGNSAEEHAGDENGKGSVPEPPETSFSMNVGVQFGLTDATSDGALKFQGTFTF